MSAVIEDVTNADPSQHDDVLQRILVQNNSDVEAFLRIVGGFLKRKTAFFKAADAEKRVAKVFREYATARSAGVKTGFFGGSKQAAKAAPEPAAPAEQPPPAAATPAPSVASASKPIEDVPDAEEEEGKGLKPNAGNGLDLERYSWTQTLGDVTLAVKVPAGTRGRDCDVSISATRLRVGVKGQAPVLDGALHKDVVVDECMWNCDGEIVEITFQKKDRMNWWSTIVAGEPELNTQKVEPENSKLSDLDGDTRQTVEKMMFDQRQKALGKPTSDEQSKQDMMKRFMQEHPEMDFSNAKMM